MSREPQRLIDVLNRGTFAVTVEYNPPKGTNISAVLENAKQLVGRVHGVNITDNNEHWTALMWAGAEGQAQVVRMLLDAEGSARVTEAIRAALPAEPLDILCIDPIRNLFDGGPVDHGRSRDRSRLTGPRSLRPVRSRRRGRRP